LEIVSSAVVSLIAFATHSIQSIALLQFHCAVVEKVDVQW